MKAKRSRNNNPPLTNNLNFIVMKIEIKYIVFELIADTKVKMQDFSFENEAFDFIKQQKKGTFIIEDIKLYHIIN